MIEYITSNFTKNQKYFGFLRLFYFDIFDPKDMFWVSKLVRIHLGTKLNYYHSKPNPNRVSNTIFSPQNFTKSEISFFPFAQDFRLYDFIKYGQIALGIF